MAAVSVGLVDGKYTIDLCYQEDSRAEVDMNIVADDQGGLIEIQGTAERGTFSTAQMQKLVGLALKGLDRLFVLQRRAVKI